MRESLRFSAMLRQPKTVSKEEKYAYVEEVIKMLNMEDFANAVVGVPGEGLNVEQRKLLTIGVELAAKPKLLLFLDEPTSGLDSQVSHFRKLLLDTRYLHCFRVLGPSVLSSASSPTPARLCFAPSINRPLSCSRNSTVSSFLLEVEEPSTSARSVRTHECC